jgi:hypothetical protein
MKDLAKGFNCCNCDEWQPFPGYVYAHWDMVLLHKCSECRWPHLVRRGDVLANGSKAVAGTAGGG